MKKFLNGLGVFGSIILTIVLTILIFVYAVILNIKVVVGGNGLSKTFKKIDFVEILKATEDGTMWEDFIGLADTLNLSEDEFEQILNSEKVKEQIGSYISEVVSSAFNNKDATLTKEKVEIFLNTAIDEYNKVSDTKISDEKRKEIINSFDEEMIANMNEEFASLNLTDDMSHENAKYIKLADNILFGNYTLIMLGAIILIIALIALFRFSYYKWIPYVKTSTTISGSLILIIGIILLVIPLQDMEILMPLKNIVTTNIFITFIILFIISTLLLVVKKYLTKNIQNEEEKTSEKKANNSKKEIVKDDKNKKKIDKKKLIFIVVVFILILIILFLLFGCQKSYTITFDTNGGSKISNIEVKDGEIVSLPEKPTKEGFTFVGWTNEEGNVITKGTKVNDNITLKAEWISNDAKTNTIKFNTDGGNEIDNVLIENGKLVLLPVNPTKDGYTFIGWIDKNGKLVIKDMIINENIELTALWIKNGIKTNTLTFDTDGGSNIGRIVVESGKIILLPVNPTKEGYVFVGWVDENGNAITKDSIVNENMTIKATWKEPYTCPANCTPIGDGSKCTRTSVKDIVTYTGCPTGTETVEKFCSSHKRQVAIGFGEDMTYETAGILCDGNPTGFCVTYSGRYTVAGESCPAGYYKYIDSDGLGALYGCTKKYNKGGSGCPSGYTKNGNKCTKTETLKCKAN